MLYCYHRGGKKVEKKKMFGTMIGVLAFVAVIAGVTYAWFAWQSEDTTISGTTGTFNINYVQGANIGTTEAGEPITPSTTKEGGVSTVFSISKDTASLHGKATLTLNIDEIAPELAVAGMKWEVYKSTSGTTIDDATYSDTALATGDFSTITVTEACSDTSLTTEEECLAVEGNTWDVTGFNPESITLFTNEQLNDVVTFYKLYIWIDGTMTNDSSMQDQNYKFNLVIDATDQANAGI